MDAAGILRLWKKMSGLPGGKSIFSGLIGTIIPYSGSIKPLVLDLEPGFARLRMKDRRGVRNHLRSIHAAALMNLGELSSGLALNVGLPATSRAIVTGFKIQFLKKARGVLTAECRTTLPAAGETRDLEVEAVIRDAANEVVARVQALWKIGPSKKSD